jgi:hypothetical protein
VTSSSQWRGTRVITHAGRTYKQYWAECFIFATCLDVKKCKFVRLQTMKAKRRGGDMDPVIHILGIRRDKVVGHFSPKEICVGSYSGGGGGWVGPRAGLKFFGNRIFFALPRNKRRYLDLTHFIQQAWNSQRITQHWITMNRGVAQLT